MMKHEAEHIEQLVMDKLAGTISAEDEALLEKAIGEDEQAAQIWQDYATALSLYKSENQHWNKAAAWEKINVAVSSKKEAIVVPLTPRRKKMAIISISAAACILIIISVTLFLTKKEAPGSIAGKPVPVIEIRLANGQKIQLEKGGKAVQTEMAQFVPDSNTLHYSSKNGSLDTSLNTLSVPQGLDYAMTLSDGTRVWVNAATKITFPLNFPSHTRKVELEGEAYFEVAKDKTKPFIVSTRNLTIQVLGTSFNVKAYPDEPIQASLVEGRVEARANPGKLLLSPGKAAVLSNNSLEEIAFDERMVLAWRKGFYFFRNEPIESINNTIQRWFGYHLQYENREIAKIRFSGALEKTETLPSFLSRLTSSANLKYSIKGDAVILEDVQ